jgi:Rod binding domain-containing protein
MDLPPLAAAPADPLARAPTLTAADLAKRGQIEKTAHEFESSFLSSMLGIMFQSVDTAPPFGGGPGEGMWKSFLADAMAGQIAKRGGIGLAHAVATEMLKLQGLTSPVAGSVQGATRS